MKHALDGFAVVFKALADETRLKILTMLTKGRTCACKILEEFNFTQPTLSYHMKQLCDSGLVEGAKEGKWVHYTLNCTKLDAVLGFLTKLNEIENPSDCICN